MLYAVPPKEAKKCGKWKLVKWDYKTDKHMEFFNDTKNIKKLYSPKAGRDLKTESTLQVMIVGPKTAMYVISQHTSPA